MHYGEWSSLKIFLLPLNLCVVPLLLLEYGAEIVSYYCSSRFSHSLLFTKFQMLLINVGMKNVEEYMWGAGGYPMGRLMSLIVYLDHQPLHPTLQY